MHFNSIFYLLRGQKWLVIFGTNIVKSGYSGPREGALKTGRVLHPFASSQLWYVLCSSVLQCTAPESLKCEHQNGAPLAWRTGATSAGIRAAASAGTI